MSYLILDLSEFDIILDYDAIKRDFDGLILRCSSGTDTSKEPNWDERISEAIKRGIPVGAYHWTACQDVDGEIELLLSRLEGYTYQLPIFVDVETVSKWTAARKNSYLANCYNFTEKIGKALEAAGYKVGVYAGADLFNNQLSDVDSSWMKWIPRYGKNNGLKNENYRPAYSGHYSGWQFTSAYICEGARANDGSGVDVSEFEDGCFDFEEAAETTTVVASNMVEEAVEWIKGIAADDSHGYCQTHRWGTEDGDYDCSGLVISAYELAGIKVKTAGATYTGNMYNAFIACGFEDVTTQVNRTTGAGLIAGDVLLKSGYHTAMYVGDGQLVEASINEKGTATGGKAGDQTGKELYQHSYYNYPWGCVLRYPAVEETAVVVYNKPVYCVAGTGKLKADMKFRQWPSTSKKIYVWEVIPSGTKIDIIDRWVDSSNGDVWYRTWYNGHYGYICGYLKADNKTYVDFSTPYENLPKIFEKGTDRVWTGVVTADELYVRSTPEKNDVNKITTVKKDKEVAVCDGRRDADGTLWYLIHMKNCYGFASSKYIEKK